MKIQVCVLNQYWSFVPYHLKRLASFFLAIEKVINERFEQCFEYADVAKNSSHDCSEVRRSGFIVIISLSCYMYKKNDLERKIFLKIIPIR